MKSRLNILIFIIIYFILCGKACDDDDARTTWQERQVTIAKDSIRSEFEADYLTEEGRYAAEIKAIQKLEDLADYAEIYTNTSLDSLFRGKAGEMIGEIFISEEARLTFGQVKNDRMKSGSLEEFLDKGFGNDVSRVELSFDSIRVLDPLEKSGEETYSGKLAAYQTIIIHPQAVSSISPAIPVRINFISSKRVKIIGTDTLKVWEVLLGDLE